MKNINYIIVLVILIAISCNTAEIKTSINTKFIDEQIERELSNTEIEYVRNPDKYSEHHNYAIEVKKDLDAIINKVETEEITYDKAIELVNSSYFEANEFELFKESCVNKESLIYNLKLLKLNILVNGISNIKNNDFSVDSLTVCIKQQKEFKFNDNVYDTKVYTALYSLCRNPMFIIDSIVSNKETKVINDTINVYKGQGYYNSNKYNIKNGILYGRAFYPNCNTGEYKVIPFNNKD